MLIDTHLHLDSEQFDDLRDGVVQRAGAAGLGALLSVGTTAESSRRTVELAHEYPLVYAAVGIQPNYAAQAGPGDWESIVALADDPRVVAIGETGLDRYWDYTPFEIQRDSFDRHLSLSQEKDLPFIVHMRDCGEDIVEALEAARERGPLRGVMHSFTGDGDLARRCLDLGLHISFAGMLTFKKSSALRAVASSIPDDRLLLETDAPYLSPHPHRGKRPNEPSLLVHTATTLAEARGVSPDVVADLTTRNAVDLFRIELETG